MTGTPGMTGSIIPAAQSRALVGGMAEGGQADYGADAGASGGYGGGGSGSSGGGFGGGGGGESRRPAARSSGGGAAKPAAASFDKQIDDEIPF